MSIQNQVVSSLPQIALNDSSGNITGLRVVSNINSVTSTAGIIVASSNLSNAQLSTSIGNGNINTGNVLNVGGNLSANGNVSFGILGGNTSFVLTSSDTATSANRGAFSVSQNLANAQRSTSIGNGQIWSGGNISSQFGNVTANVTMIVNKGDSAVAGITTGTAFYGGSNTASNPVVMLNGSNTTLSGTQLLAQGAERWFSGRDNSSNVGNFVIRSNAAVNNFTILPGAGTTTLNSSNVDQTLSYGGNMRYNTGVGNFHIFNNVTFRTPPILTYTGSQQSILNNGLTLITFTQDTISSTVSLAVMGLSFSSAIWTNITGNEMYLLVNASVSYFNNNTGSRMLIVSNDTTTNDGGTSYARVQVPATQGLFTDINCSGVFRLPAGGSFCVKCFQNSGGTLNLGSSPTHPTSITITRI
jgi:hypothetical protein